MDIAKRMFTGNRNLFIISDLHIGDGSSRDNLIKNDKISLFNRFLDEVEKQNGLILILGDLLELWRTCGLTGVIQWLQDLSPTAAIYRNSLPHKEL